MKRGTKMEKENHVNIGDIKLSEGEKKKETTSAAGMNSIRCMEELQNHILEELIKTHGEEKGRYLFQQRLDESKNAYQSYASIDNAPEKREPGIKIK